MNFVAEEASDTSLACPGWGGSSGRLRGGPDAYVADGHHRTKSASRAREELIRREGEKREDALNRVMSVVFPDDQLSILPYNRVLLDLGGRSPEDILASLMSPSASGKPA